MAVERLSTRRMPTGVLLLALAVLALLTISTASAADGTGSSSSKATGSTQPGSREARRKEVLQRAHNRNQNDLDTRRAPPSRNAKPQVPFFGNSKAGRAALTTLPGTWIVQLSMPSAAVALAPPTGDRATVAAVVADPSTDRRGRNVTAAQAHALAVDASISDVARDTRVEKKIKRRFNYALSGFTVKDITVAELQALRSNPQVVSVTPSRLRKLNTYTSPWFLGLTSKQGESSAGGGWDTHGYSYTQPQGVWDKLGGVVGPDGAGEDVIIGVLDTGIYMDDHPSFADAAYWPAANDLRGQSHSAPPKGWKGICQANGDGTPFPCNNKVIGCRYFADALFENFGGIPEGEILSCRDFEGHGTHTTATAGGNYGAVSDLAQPGTFLSGIAPRARIAVYKVLWAIGSSGFGLDADIAAAIEAAIIDGVDVLSSSLGDDVYWDTMADPVQLAFMHAARAGIVSAQSAGNAGPQLSTVSNNGPHTITVAASTINRKLAAPLTLGSSEVVVGSALLSAPFGPYPLVYAGDAALAGQAVKDARRCFNATLDPAKTTGKIVACDRGTTLFVEKVAEVQRVGGIGVVMMNVPDGATTVFARTYALPYIHIDKLGREAVLNYTSEVADAATATIGATSFDYDVVAPEMASFSSRGPFPLANGAVLSPDVTGPGVDILAATAPIPSLFQGLYAYFSGTSMACPHVSGLAALLLDAHPHWDPQTIKSAMMTTAYTRDTAGNVFGTPLDFGAGHIKPATAFNPGLVITSTYNDWQTLLCAAEPHKANPECERLCPSAQLTPSAQIKARQLRSVSEYSDDEQPRRYYDEYHHSHAINRLVASTCPDDKVSFDINGPWISGNVGDTLIVRRTLTSVCAEEGPVHFRAVASAAPGSRFSISVWPPELTLSEGESETVTIVVKAMPDTPLNEYQTGQVVWFSNRDHAVRIPVSVNFRAVLAPDVIDPVPTQPDFGYDYGIRTAGPTSVTVRTTGLQPATVEQVAMEGSDEEPPFGIYPFNLTDPVEFFAAGLFLGDQPAVLDMELWAKDGEEPIAVTRRGHQNTSLIEVSNLPAGEYELDIYAVDWDENTFDAQLNMWYLSYVETQESGGLMTVSPFSTVPVTPDGTGALSLSFKDINIPASVEETPIRYLGYIGYQREDSASTDTTRVSLFFPRIAF